MTIPSRARRIAGSNSRAHGSFPSRRCASSYAATAPGTVTESGPSTFASFLTAGHPYMPDRAAPPTSSNISGRDASGARVDPSKELVLPSCHTTRPAIPPRPLPIGEVRSEEHTSELQSHHDLVCRLLLEKK